MMSSGKITLATLPSKTIFLPAINLVIFHEDFDARAANPPAIAMALSKVKSS
jgi:hypothetical protein